MTLGRKTETWSGKNLGQKRETNSGMRITHMGSSHIQHPSLLPLLLLLLLPFSFLSTCAAQSLHGFTQEAFLITWAENALQNLPPYYWNNLFAFTLTSTAPPSAPAQCSFSSASAGTSLLNSACPEAEQPGWQGITCDSTSQNVISLNLSYASLPAGSQRLRGALSSLQCPPSIASLPSLSSIDLSGNLLNHSIPVEYGQFPALKHLNLAHNSLSGPIPTQLCSLHLSCFNVAGNNLSGPIPSCFNSFPCVDFQGNKHLERSTNDCDSTTLVSSCERVALTVYAPPPPPAAPSGLSAGAVVGIVLGILLFLALLLFAFVLIRRIRAKHIQEEKRRQLASDVESHISSRHFGSLVRFGKEELSKACNNFDDDNILGEGGYSVVYKGRLDQGLEVAIKRIKPEKMKDGSELEFLNEVEIISRAAHKNLVQSVGFCVEPSHALMLVLHYYSNGSVAGRTYGKEGNPLNWETRQQIAKGAADGVAYLHNDCNPKLIHRDIKAENVLLSEVDEAAIADFGLTAEMEKDETHRETQVKGTIGHIAPEYILSGRCSEKTDVYAFGTFLLELLSGKSIQEVGSLAEARDMMVADWVARCIEEDDLVHLIDADLQGADEASNEDDMIGMLMLALLCMRTNPVDRPDMNEVAQKLVPRGMQDQLGKWREEAQTLGQIGEEDAVDPLQWELDNADLGDDTIGSSVLNSSYFGSSLGNSAGPIDGPQ